MEAEILCILKKNVTESASALDIHICRSKEPCTAVQCSAALGKGLNLSPPTPLHQVP
eukprot:IDg2363t1